jgi:hypothetical protein
VAHFADIQDFSILQPVAVVAAMKAIVLAALQAIFTN